MTDDNAVNRREFVKIAVGAGVALGMISAVRRGSQTV